MVLAAGLGTRLRPLTYEITKPMVPVLDRPVMEHILDLLDRHSFGPVIANLHYFAQTIREYFGERIEGAPAQLAERADVVPVLVQLVDVKRHVVLEQRGEHVLGPVDERTLGEVVEDLGLEHVDAAVAQLRQRLLGRRLLLEAGHAALAVM